MQAKTFEDFFLNELSDVYNAEKQLTRALPKLAKACHSAELKAAFTSHLHETEGQVKRLEKIFAEEDLKPKRKKCAAMQGLIEESRQSVAETEAGPLLDAALVIIGQKIEHYEIAAYGALEELARMLGYETATRLLGETLEEEKSADAKLTSLAVSTLNQDAKGMEARV